MWVEVFSAGRHTCRQGVSRNYTEADLDAMVERYDPGHHEAPVVIGHPKHNDPAYGWVAGLKREGKLLMADLKQLAPEFKKWVNAGRFKKRSVSIYPDGRLRHVGFLGAVPPAVHGLADVQFSEGDEVTYEFSQNSAVQTMKHLLGRLRDLIIEKWGREDADSALPGWLLEDLDRQGEEDVNSFSQPQPEEDPMTDEERRRIEALEKKLGDVESDFSEQLKTKDEEIAALKAERDDGRTKLDQAEKSQARAEFASFCEELEKKGQLTPKQKAQAVEFMGLLQPLEAHEFSEGETKPPLEAFKDFLGGLPVQVEFGEKATRKKAANRQGAQAPSEFSEAGDVDAGRLEIHNQAVEMSAAEGISYTAAVERIFRAQ